MEISLWGLMLRVVLAAVLGGVIGLERELQDRTAGFRTHLLVAMGAAAFTLVSAYGFQPWVSSQPTNVAFDPGRVAAQIVTGVGFLGAGAIIRRGPTVRGLTTAAGLWASAAVGMAAGVGMYELAVIVSALVILSLYALGVVEHRIIMPRIHDVVCVTVRFRERGFEPLGPLVAVLDEGDVTVKGMTLRSDGGDDDAPPTVRFTLKLPPQRKREDLVRSLAEVEGIADVGID